MNLSAQKRLAIIKKASKKPRSVAQICKEARISRKTFYKWKKRLEMAAPGTRLASLKNKKREYIPQERYFCQATKEQEEAVLKIVLAHPEYSTAKISAFLPTIDGRPLLGNHGVQNVLKRLSLSHYQARLAYVKAQETVFKPVTIPTVSPVFNLPLRIVRMAIAPFATIPKGVSFRVFGLAFVFSFLLSTSAHFWLRMVSQAPAENKIGLIFATISILCGTFFFLYSMKYYLTLAIVLGFSRHVGPPSPEASAGKEGYKGGLQENLDHIRLERSPFVSIHLPVYNERKVVNRLLTACTSMDYENYEVIVIDDSNDETTKILEDWKNHPRVKIIHRTSRAGFKGGALREALRASSPKAEFIVVFDADFIPYPDTITQFLKYFKSVVGSLTPGDSKIACVQGYQWHVLNKSENWITRGVRSEYAGSYVVERSGTEVLGALKMIAGSVYMIRADLLRKYGWGTSITEDFELTLRLYQDGYKVIYTPYVQGPAECVATIKRLVRQRMRWAEGHSHNIRSQFAKILSSSNMTLTEKLEFLYLTPYYLQATLFLIGTLSWLTSETVFRARLPFWTSLWGWSLVLTNMFSLPLMNTVGLFLEESEERDYLGVLSFVALSYLLVPFQAYASVKGFLESQEGPWFRTPKTGKITDIFTRGKFYRWITGIIPARRPAPAFAQASAGKPAFTNPYLALATANNRFNGFAIRPRHLRWVGNLIFSLFIFLTSALMVLAPFIPLVQPTLAQGPGRLVTIEEAMRGQVKPKQIESEEITTPRTIHFPTATGETLEMIFHQEPRVRIKLGEKEMEITTAEIEGLGAARPRESLLVGNKEVRYEEIVPGVDLVYKITRQGFKEEFVLKKRLPITGVKQRLIAKEIKVVSPIPSVFGFYDSNDKEVFKFREPYMFEEKDQDKINRSVLLALKKGIVGYDLEKEILPEGLAWLNDPQRVYPVVLDPTTIIASGFAAGEEEYGGNQRKLVYVNSNYYAVSNDASSIQLWKSATGSSWSQLSDLDDDNDDHNPTMVVEGSDFWVAWNDNSTDNPQFRKIITSTDTYQAVCTGPDMGAVAAADVNAFAVGLTLLFFGNDNDPDLYMITKSEYPATCESTDFTVITNTTAGPTVGSRMIFERIPSGEPSPYNDALHTVWNNGGIKHGRYYAYYSEGLLDWIWTWGGPYTVGGISQASFSLVKDSGESLYVLTESATGDANVYKCAATCTGTWSNLGIAISDTNCASGYTDILYTSLTYDSAGTDSLFAFVIASDGTNERACFRRSTNMGVTWEATTWDMGWVSTDLAHISSIHTVTDPSKAAVTLRNAATYSFATVPEKSLILLLLAPFLPKTLKALKRKKHR